jgi:hypothetical protein
MLKFKELLLGTDPEMFIVSKEGDYVHPKNVTLGTKKHPINMGQIVVHQDGAAAEFSIPPVSNEDDWNNFIELGLNFLRRPGMSFYPKCAIELPVDTIETYPELSEIGCSPDLILHEGEFCVRKLSYQKTNWRMCGGHIHIGCGPIEDEELLKQIVKDLDENLLDWMATQEWYDKETEEIRKAHYGMPGVIRIKPYGFEYRSPSNGWIFKEEDRKAVFNRVQKIMKNYMVCGDSVEKNSSVITEKLFA